MFSHKLEKEDLLLYLLVGNRVLEFYEFESDITLIIKNYGIGQNELHGLYYSMIGKKYLYSPKPRVFRVSDSGFNSFDRIKKEMETKFFGKKLVPTQG